MYLLNRNMLNIYNNVVRYMYTERKQMRNMVHQYERGLYHHTGKNGEAQLKFELNNYLFRGLINPLGTRVAIRQRKKKLVYTSVKMLFLCVF